MLKNNRYVRLNTLNVYFYFNSNKSFTFIRKISLKCVLFAESKVTSSLQSEVSGYELTWNKNIFIIHDNDPLRYNCEMLS